MRSRPWLCISTMASAAAFALSGASLAQSCGDPNAGDCCVSNGSPFCDDAECCNLICGQDPFCCNNTWDQICANAAVAQCSVCDGGGGGNPACGPDAGDCCIANGTPGCNDTECCEAVCAADAFCCNNTWDTICANAALATCAVCGGGGSGCGPDNPQDCCVANGLPGCSDETCCNTVCSLDPFCCDTAWDQACANAAFANCPETCSLGGICGPDNPQDCCVAGAAPGCSDENCCNAVCAADPFCCQTAWDGLCAGAAALTCIELCGVPCDTTCPAGSQIEAELCGEDTNGGCNGGGIYEDISVPGTVCGTFWAEGGTRDTDWYRFNLAEPSIVTITINTTAPAAIGLLDATCGPLVYIFDGAAGCGSSVSFCLPAGESVAFVAPGGFDGLPCGGEFNDYVLSISIDGACEPLVCGSPDTGDCCVANGTPFCDDAECCSAVCAADPFCCDTAWDQICADTAQLTCIELCGVPCDTTCPAGSQTEAELCGEDTNGGCNSPTGIPAYQDIAVPGTLCGTFWAEGGTRDTDWFRFNLEESTIVTVTINATAPAAIGLLDGNCPPGVLAFVAPATCGSSVSFCMPAGENVVFVAPAGFDGLPCGGEFNNYVVTISLDGPCEALACGSPGTGDCCIANGTPFCEDAECCEAICAADPFCCNTAWDQLCADAAVAQCAGCGGGGGGCGEPGTGDCCSANGTPFCDDAECCNLICAADPFCCNTAWDTLCAEAALAQCAVCSGGGVKNDECAGAFAITAGDTAFSTVGATTSLPPLDPSCNEGFGLAFVNDVWYAYLATATGTVTVSTCGQASFDTRLAAYTGSCEDLSLVACNDDGAGCPGFTSLMTFEAVCGETYIIRVGGFATSGTGTISLTQAGTCPSPCPADLDGDGSVGPSDLAILLGQWGGSGSADLSGNGSVGPEDLALLLGAWGPC